MKKILLIVIDGCTLRVLSPALKNNQLPNLQALARAGSLTPCTTIFPSITPAATASIVTGCYPHEHGIGGAYWYNTECQRIDYYGDDWPVIINEGMGKFFRDFLIKMNNERLRADTLYQMVERAGLQAASINYLIFHGDQKHKLNVPFLLSLLPGIPAIEEVQGPSILCLGDFVSSKLRSDKELSTHGGITQRYGIGDGFTMDLLIEMAGDNSHPDFTLAYFPDYDFLSHKIGPDEAMPEMARFDQRLGRLFQAWGGIARMLKELCVIVTSDHSHCNLDSNEDQLAIKIDQILPDFTLAEVGLPWSGADQVLACPNMRAAQIYLHTPDKTNIDSAVANLMVDPRIDQVLWCANLTDSTARGYQVATRSRGTLHFWRGNDGPNTAKDEQGCQWSWQGNLKTVDGRVSAEGILTFPDYPNAFERIACALEFENGGHLWMTAWPGYEFKLPGIQVHTGGGSHGSLHAVDTISPLLIAGAPPEIIIPNNPRIVDIAPLCLNMLGIKPRRAVGEPHI